MNLFQSAANLLCFVLKYKMVAVAMFNLFLFDFMVKLHVKRQT